MKNIFTTLFLFVLIFSACHKDATINSLPPNGPLAEDKGCMNQLVIPVTSHGTISDSVYNLVNNLFVTNGVYHVNFRYNRAFDDSEKDYDGTNDYWSVRIVQYINGLPVFGESLNYLFKNSQLHYNDGNIINGTNIGTTPTLSLGQLRKLFVDDIINDTQLNNLKGNLYTDSCFNAEFGYYNLSPNSAPANLVKAWHLTPKNSNYPEAYYQDPSGQRLYYTDGIETKKGK